MQRRILILMLAVAAAACGSDKSENTGPATIGAGSFTLVRINGRGLPADLSSRIVYAGSLDLDASGEYTREQRDSSRAPTGTWDRVLSQDHGTWSSRGDSVFLTTFFERLGYSEGRGVFTATGAKISTKNPFAVANLELEFQRQP